MQVSESGRSSHPPLSLQDGLSRKLGLYIVHSSVQTVISWVISAHDALSEVVKFTVRKVQAIFAYFYDALMKSHLIETCVEKVISWFVMEKELVAKLQAEKEALDLKAGSPIASQYCHLLATLTQSLLETSLDRAKEWSAEKRPPWISSLLVEESEGQHFTLKGHVVHSYVKNKSALITQCLELNFLKIISSFIDRLHKLQNDDGQLLYKLVNEGLEKINVHFYNCKAKEAVAQINLPAAHSFEEEEQEREEFFNEISKILIAVLLPNAENEFELPVKNIVASYFRKPLFELIKNELIPQGVRKLFSKLVSGYTKDMLLLMALELIRDLVDEEHEIDSTTAATAQSDALKRPLFECFLAVFEYIDPAFMPWALKNLGPQKLAEAASKYLCNKLQQRTLKKVFLEVLELTAPLVNPGGKWEEEAASQHFVQAPFIFKVSPDEYEKAKEEKKQGILHVKQQIDDLLVNIGKEAKGLKRIAKDSVSATPAPGQPKEDSSSSWSGWVYSAVTSAYKSVSDKGVEKAFELVGVTEKVQSLTGSMVEKMRDPAHEKIVCELITLIARRVH